MLRYNEQKMTDIKHPMSSNTASPKTRKEAMNMATATQKPGQTKEQTKLIAQGIEKGISRYKTQEKIKARARDKGMKKQRKATQSINLTQETHAEEIPNSSPSIHSFIPWGLLVLSWISFLIYQFIAT